VSLAPCIAHNPLFRFLVDLLDNTLYVQEANLEMFWICREFVLPACCTFSRSSGLSYTYDWLQVSLYRPKIGPGQKQKWAWASPSRHAVRKQNFLRYRLKYKNVTVFIQPDSESVTQLAQFEKPRLREMRISVAPTSSRARGRHFRSRRRSWKMIAEIWKQAADCRDACHLQPLKPPGSILPTEHSSGCGRCVAPPYEHVLHFRTC